MDTVQPTDIRNSRAAARPRQNLLVGFGAVLLVCLFAGWHVSAWPLRLRYPGVVDTVEGIDLAEMQHLHQGIPIYATASPGRFDSAIYGPLFYLLGDWLIDTQNPGYFRLRLLSLLATLGCAAGCGLLAFWIGRSWLAATLAPLMLLAYRLVTSHGIVARCDMVALLLFFWGFLAAYRFQSSRALLVAVPPIVIGFYYKQHFVAAPLAVLLFLLLEKRYRLALEFAGLLAVGGLGMLALLHYVVFHGQSFLLHFLTYNLLPLPWNRLGLGMLVFGVVFGVPLLVALEFLRLYPNRLLSCYLGFAVLVAVVTVAREGSRTNYFLECVLVLSVLFSALLAQRGSDPTYAAGLTVLLGVALFVGQRLGTLNPRPEDFGKDRVVQDYLRQHFPPQTEALGYYAGDLVRAGLAVPIPDLFQFGWQVRKGTVSDHDLLARLEHQRFGLVLLNYDLERKQDPRWADYYMTATFRELILANYRLVTILDMPGPEKFHDDDRFYLWVPRPQVESVSPAVALSAGQTSKR
jgi:hypothetical protein